MNSKNQDSKDRSRQLLNGYFQAAADNLTTALDTRGITPQTLSAAMSSFIQSLLEPPQEIACKPSCAYCCHLRVGVSIAEAVVIFLQIKANATDQGLAHLKQRVTATDDAGNTLKESWWRTTQSPCPFLDVPQKNVCLIYALRPFSCRAYHSTDAGVCQNGFDTGKKIQIPCFPLYRAATDMYATAFIQVLAQKGLFSYQVGFVRALRLLFDDESIIQKWLEGHNAFISAKLS